MQKNIGAGNNQLRFLFMKGELIMKQDKFMEEVKEIIRANILKKVLPRLIPERDIKQDKSI